MSYRSSHAHYKATRTVTGPDGKTYTETIEMDGDDAANFMKNLRGHHHQSDSDDFGFPSALEHRSGLREGLRHMAHPHAERRKANHQSPSASPKESPVSDRRKAGQSREEFQKEALEVHNKLRKRHGVGPLRLNNDLSKLAQKWADHLAATDTFEHSSTQYRNTKVGENLYAQSWPMTGKEMTEAWYNEIAQYDYRNPCFQPSTGHFTQVVWKGSEEVGFAFAQGSRMNTAVAMYFPPGNYVHDFANNVLPSRS